MKKLLPFIILILAFTVSAQKKAVKQTNNLNTAIYQYAASNVKDLNRTGSMEKYRVKYFEDSR